ncbi:phage tail tape measure protein [Glaesserella parasuis]|uniref:phage tail tape measure protein n=2 Tax=Glaesserella parasuis TaxID=738 RepID=UPI00135D38F0|nr:phage tail tape measure protein [Glaesserella parasuis]MDG6857656.1 phage tail tape measure protein [Glaesserella parasuis]MDO9655742.1 phage tail tape measure protein [Glaesserella parasuis]MDO9658240.1 phage tail tape measure protein [Glaesserella parasuis]MDO9667048.1 phage tail tape measure protein [Glaesserella parasuis]MDO9738425.1 phage tail tape measure protein [Glaesserella parasuis]
MAKEMKVQLELNAKDNANQVISKVGKEAEKAFKDTEQAAVRSSQTQVNATEKVATATQSSNKRIEQAYREARKSAADLAKAREMLGIRSENAIQQEIRQTRVAYEQLKRSGVASQNELRRASEQTKQRIKELNAELGRSSFGDKAASVGRGLIGVGVGVAAGAMVMREPARNQMDFDKRLAMVANTAYSDRDVQGRIAGKEDLFKAVEKAVKVGRGTKEDALNSLDTLLASGVISADTAMNLLPTLQKAAVATGATPDDIAKIVISSMQQMGIGEQDIGKVLDMAVAAGQAGQFELADMAAWLPQQMAAGKQAGLNGLEGFKRLLIANQQARVTAGSSDEAGNNLVNLLGKITAKETNNRFKNLKYKDPKTGKEKGINFAKSMEHYKGKGQDSLQAFMSIMDDVVGSDKQYQELQNKLKTAKGAEQAKLFKELTDLVEGAAIGEIISDRQALMALLGIKNNIQLGQEVDKKVENSQDAVEKSHAVVRDTNAHKVEALKNSNEFSQMKNFEQVNNVLGALSEQLAKYANEYPNLTQFLVGAKDAVFTFGAALAAFSVLDLLRGGKGGKSSVIGSVIETVATKGKGGLKVGTGGLGFAAVGLGLYGASEGYVPYMARQEAEKEKRAEAEKKFRAQHSSKPSVFTYGNAAMGGIKPQHNYHGAYVVAERLNDNKIAQERGRQGTLSEAEMKSRLERNQAIIDGEIRPSVEATTGVLSNYQADFQAFGQSISMAIEAGLTSQSHTLANNITLEVDGRVLAEYVSNEQFNFNKRVA